MTASPRRSLTVVPDSATLGSLLRRKRLTENRTQADLAKVFGVRQQTVGSWERGERPQARFAGAIADYLALPDEVRSVILGSGAPNTPALPPPSESAHPDPASQSGSPPTRQMPLRDAGSGVQDLQQRSRRPVDELVAALASRVQHGPLSHEEAELFREFLRVYKAMDAQK
jgi:transcriptional regulator with XRE-family HTH domain